MEYGEKFSTYLGWTIPSESEIVLVTDSVADAHAAVMSMGLIGIEHIRCQVGAKELSAVVGEESIPAIDFVEYFEHMRSRPHQLLDVRNPSEHRENRLPGAKQIPIYEVAGRLGELDPAIPVVVHCAAGYRASAAGSLLAQRGFDVIVIDDDVANGLAYI
jgi:rhodanese-related sulfurtransferase